MAKTFCSVHAQKIWDNLYTVYIPDLVTQDAEYLKRFGHHVSQYKPVDEMLKTNLILVKIPIIKILEYYVEGIEIQIPSREDMITMHKHLELYLEEWREYIRNSVHGQVDAELHKDLILSLEKLSKYVYEKAKPRELLENLFLANKTRPGIGLVNPLVRAEQEQRVVDKPDYNSIKQLIKKKNNNSDSGGRFG